MADGNLDVEKNVENADKSRNGLILAVLAVIAASIFAAGLFLGGIARCTNAKEVMNAIATGMFFAALVFVIPASVANMATGKSKGGNGRPDRKKWVTAALLIGGIVALAALVLTIIGWF